MSGEVDEVAVTSGPSVPSQRRHGRRELFPDPGQSLLDGVRRGAAHQYHPLAWSLTVTVTCEAACSD